MSDDDDEAIGQAKPVGSRSVSRRNGRKRRKQSAFTFRTQSTSRAPPRQCHVMVPNSFGVVAISRAVPRSNIGRFARTSEITHSLFSGGTCARRLVRSKTIEVGVIVVLRSASSVTPPCVYCFQFWRAPILATSCTRGTTRTTWCIAPRRRN